MALNITEWSSDQVSQWLSGLGPAVARYVPGLRERGLDGAKLLTLRCDDLEYLGVHIIGHQELLLEAVEHLRNFQYEVDRECVQQLALRVSVVATSLARALRHQPDARLETQTLADVARTVHAIKPLVCWLDRWALCSVNPLAERRAALLKLSLEAATCAQRERFAEHPARAVAAAAAAAAATADYIIQDVCDPMILQPASLDSVTLQQGERPLGFGVVPSFCGHHQLADIRFGSPAHACGTVHEGDEIVQVASQCVIGWSGEAVLAACRAAGSELALRLRRRGARTALATPQMAGRPRVARRLQPAPRPHLYTFRTPLPPTPRATRLPHVPQTPCASPPLSTPLKESSAELDDTKTTIAAPPKEVQEEAGAVSSSDESEPLSPPASPTQLHLDHTRMYPRKPRTTAQRRYTVCGGSPVAKRPALTIDQFWQELREQRWQRGGSPLPAGAMGPDDGEPALYRRDKALSCSTGLELSPRPQTCLGVSLNHPMLNKLKAQNARLLAAEDTSPTPAPPPQDLRTDRDRTRGKLDKSHSTPAYDFDNNVSDEHSSSSLVTQIIPESPTTPTDSPTIMVHSAEKADQILDFKKSSSQIGEAILQQQKKAQEVTITERTEVKTEIITEVTTEVTTEISIHENDNSKTEKVLETINIAMMERQKDSSISRLSSGHTPLSQMGKSFSVSEQVRNIQEEIVQAINEQRLSSKYPKPQIPAKPSEISSELKKPQVPSKKSDTPPEPPPRPPSTQRAVLREPPLPPTEAPREYPVLRPVPRSDLPDQKEYSPIKPIRSADLAQISVPLRHITKHDIRVIPSERRELPPINGEADNVSITEVKGLKREGTVGVEGCGSPVRAGLSPGSATVSALSPAGGVVRGMFPSSKTKSLKKKNSILAKRRGVAARELAARGVSGAVWQRVRPRLAATPRWARRHLLLADNLLYAYRTPECSKADCMIYLEGFTVCAAGEVKSRAHAFKVYHTGTAFYFAAETRDTMLAWIQLIHRATLLPPLPPSAPLSAATRHAHTSDQLDVSVQFSETDYSETESDAESSDKKEAKEKEGDKERDKDKSKFGSLKKLTQRAQRSESQENVSHSTSLDRKYLRFFSRHKSKDESKPSKLKQSGVPVPTEHYRVYRRVPPPTAASNTAVSTTSVAAASVTITVTTPASPTTSVHGDDARKKIPKPINYIHASNPNLLDFEKSDFVTKPNMQVPKSKIHKPDNFIGFVTLEQFMLQKQEEERRQVYTNRVLMGVERDRSGEKKAAKELQKRLDRIVPDVIYGELPAETLPVPVLEHIQGRSLPRAPPTLLPRHTPARHDDNKPVSVKGKDGYEKIVYPDEQPTPEEVSGGRTRPPSCSAAELGYETIYDEEELGPGLGAAGAGSRNRGTGRPWRDSLRRNDKVHSGGVGATAAAPPLKSAAQYTPLPVPPSGQLHLPAAPDSWSGGAGGGGVSRLRQMFGGNRPARPARLVPPPPHSHNVTEGGSGSGNGGGAGSDGQQSWGWRGAGGAPQYPHLQCPPTFQPETYSLAKLAPPQPPPRRDPS